MSNHLPGYDAWASQGNEPAPESWPWYFDCPACKRLERAVRNDGAHECRECGHVLTRIDWAGAGQCEPEKESDRE